MKTLLLAVTLMNSQPAMPQFDSPGFDTQAFAGHFKSYLVEDLLSVSNVINASLREGISFAALVDESPSVEPELTAQHQPIDVSKSCANEVQ